MNFIKDSILFFKGPSWLFMYIFHRLGILTNGTNVPSSLSKREYLYRTQFKETHDFRVETANFFTYASIFI